MKKFLLLITLCIAPVYALCPVDYTGENLCTLPNSGTKTQPMFMNPNFGSNISQPQKQLQPRQVENLSDRMKNQNLQYDSSCQFGVCVQDLNNTENKNQ